MRATLEMICTAATLAVGLGVAVHAASPPQTGGALAAPASPGEPASLTQRGGAPETRDKREEVSLLGPGVPRWESTWGGDADDDAAAVVRAPDGGLVIGATSASAGLGAEDAWLIRTDAEGRWQWDRTYGGNKSDRLHDLVGLGGRGLLIVGESRGGAQRSDAWAVRVDPEGRQLWSAFFGGRDDDRASAGVDLPDGGFALAGVTHSSGDGKGDAWLIRLGPSGEEIWSRTFGATGWDAAHAIAVTGSGDLLIAGEQTRREAVAPDLWLARVPRTGQGDPLWELRLGAEGTDRALGLLALDDGGALVAGETEGREGRPDGWVVRTDAAGQVLWQRRLGGLFTDRLHAAVALPDRGFALAGLTHSKGYGSTGIGGLGNAWLVRLDEHGQPLWDRAYGGPGAELARALVLTEPGVVLVGGTHSEGAGREDAWVIEARLHHTGLQSAAR